MQRAIGPSNVIVVGSVKHAGSQSSAFKQNARRRETMFIYNPPLPLRRPIGDVFNFLIIYKVSRKCIWAGRTVASLSGRQCSVNFKRELADR